jgi:dephospho-CoA kinase
MAGFVVAITGGVASGKTAVTRLFEALGVVVVDADSAARAVVAPGEPGLAEIVDRFGPELLLADQSLDRAQLRQRIFSDAAAKRDLEAIIHPRVRVLLHAQCLEAPGPYAMVAIPLLAETGSSAAYPWLQRILVVDTPVALQRARLIVRDGIDADLAERMIAAQASREQRLSLATDVLVNDGNLSDLEAPVHRLDRFYRELAS